MTTKNIYKNSTGNLRLMLKEIANHAGRNRTYRYGQFVATNVGNGVYYIWNINTDNVIARFSTHTKYTNTEIKKIDVIAYRNNTDYAQVFMNFTSKHTPMLKHKSFNMPRLRRRFKRHLHSPSVISETERPSYAEMAKL